MIKTIALCGILIAPAINGAVHDYLIIDSQPKAALCGLTLGVLSLTAMSAIYKFIDNDICKLIASTTATAAIYLTFIIAYKNIYKQHQKAINTYERGTPEHSI